MNAQPIPIFKYVAVEVPAQSVVEAELAEKGSSPAAERFAERVNLLSQAGKAMQLIQFPGFILIGEITATMLMEHKILPGMMPPGGLPQAPGSRRQ